MSGHVSHTLEESNVMPCTLFNIYSGIYIHEFIKHPNKSLTESWRPGTGNPWTLSKDSSPKPWLFPSDLGEHADRLTCQAASLACSWKHRKTHSPTSLGQKKAHTHTHDSHKGGQCSGERFLKDEA